MTDYYDILGVRQTATTEEIRAAHRAQSRLHHPDTADDGRGDPARFTRVQEAYDVLANPESRRHYDLSKAADDELPQVDRRRPRMTPCAVCKKLVHPSQLSLYLGRHMCQACNYRRKQKSASRANRSGTGEFLWRLKCLGFWLKSHLAVILLVLITGGVAAARVAMIYHHSRHHGRSNEQMEEIRATLDSVPAAQGRENTNLHESARIGTNQN